MPVILKDGTIADTGVAQEGFAHQFMESLAHQRDAGPIIQGGLFTSIGWTSNYTGSPPTMNLSPAWDALLFVQTSGVSPPFQETYPYYPAGINDVYGWPALNPSISPVIKFSGASAWGANVSGNPHQLANGYEILSPPKNGSYGGIGAYCFNFGESVKLRFLEWQPPGIYTFTLLLTDIVLLSIPQSGMNSDFAGTITFGDVTLIFSRAAGWSGVGISANAVSGSSPNVKWIATFTHNFITRWQADVSIGPMGVYNKNPKNQGGGTIAIF